MAGLIRRAPLLTALGALAILVAYQPPHQPSQNVYYGDWQSYPTAEGRLAKRLGDDYHRAEQRAGTRSLRDSLMRSIVRRPSRPGTILRLAGGGRAMDSVAQIVLRDAAPPMPSLYPEVRGVFALLPGSTWGTRSHIYLPLATDGRTCLVTVAIDPDFRYRAPRFVQPRQELGPCAFFLTFGLPGPKVARWLESRAYDIGMSPDWQTRPHAPYPQIDGGGVSGWLQATLSHLGGQTVPFDYWGIGGGYWGSFAAVGCAARKADACRRHFFSPQRGEMLTAVPGVVERNRYFSDASDHLLAMLVREQGPERFARFWRSPLPPEQAFDQAFTVPFPQWASDWARTTYGRMDVGVVTRGREIGTSLAWVMVCVGVCLGLAVSRRVA